VACEVVRNRRPQRGQKPNKLASVAGISRSGADGVCAIASVIISTTILEMPVCPRSQYQPLPLRLIPAPHIGQNNVAMEVMRPKAV
jgi:hypothetical protein